MTDRTYGLFGNEINKRLIERLMERKAGIVRLPPVVYQISEDVPAIDLDVFDWVVFTDIVGVDPMLNNTREKFGFDEIRVCAFGEAISDRLRFAQLHADVIPPRVDPNSVFQAISDYQPPAGSHFLMVKDGSISMPLSGLLQNAGAGVVEMNIHTSTSIPDISRYSTLLLSGAVDEFIFTSPQDVFDLVKFIDPQKIDGDLSAADEITLQTLSEFGLSAAIFKQ